MTKPRRSDLGSPITRYHLQELRWRDLFIVFVPLTIGVLAPVGVGLWRTLYGYSSFGPAAAFFWGRNWFLAGGFLVILLLLYAFRRLKRAHTWIEVYSWGLYFQIPPGRKRFVNWKDIHGITSFSVKKSFFHVINRTVHHLTIHSRKYPPLQCHPEIHDREGLKKTIKKQVYNRLRPTLLQAFKKENIIPFGEVSVSKQKLFLSKQEIPWEYINGISVQKGVFNIKLSADKKIEVPIRKIHNIEILLHLIKTEI